MDPLLTRTGLIVPRITRWSDEVIDPKTIWLTPGINGVRYRDQRASDRFLGMLWHRERECFGRGEPLWKQVHTKRQRQAMLDPRCQVCYTRLASTDIPWLIPETEYDQLRLVGKTVTPPTCEDCWTIAEERCPNLRRGVIRLHVSRALPWGVMGDIYHPLRREPDIWIELTSPHLPHVIARQLAVHLEQITLVGRA